MEGHHEEDPVLEQIDEALRAAAEGRPRRPLHHDRDPDRGATTDQAAYATLITLRATIDRITPPGSPYREAADALTATGTIPGYQIERLAGILQAYRDAYAAGHMQGFAELIHGEVFTDFLEMASYLHSEGYKDAAAVIAGTVLEEHLRKLAAKSGLAVERDDGRPHKVETLNAELKKAGVYGEPQRKQIGAWYGIRTDAAHGNRDQYTQEEVNDMIRGIGGLLARLPA